MSWADEWPLMMTANGGPPRIVVPAESLRGQRPDVLAAANAGVVDGLRAAERRTVDRWLWEARRYRALQYLAGWAPRSPVERARARREAWWVLHEANAAAFAEQFEPDR